MKELAAVLFMTALVCSAQTSMEVAGSGAGLMFSNPVGYQGIQSGNVPTNPASFKSAWLVVARFTLNTGRWLAHEPGFGWGHSTLEMPYNDIMTFHIKRDQKLFFYNLLVCAMPEDARFRVCAAGGPHLIAYDMREKFSVLFRQEETKYGVNFGGVAKFRVGEKFLVRADFREYMNGRPLGLLGKTGWLQQREVSAGFGVRF